MHMYWYEKPKNSNFYYRKFQENKRDNTGKAVTHPRQTQRSTNYIMMDDKITRSYILRLQVNFERQSAIMSRKNNIIKYMSEKISPLVALKLFSDQIGRPFDQAASTMITIRSTIPNITRSKQACPKE